MRRAQADDPVLTIDREANAAMPPGGGFNVLHEDLSFVRSMRRDDEPAPSEGNVRDAFQTNPLVCEQLTLVAEAMLPSKGSYV